MKSAQRQCNQWVLPTTTPYKRWKQMTPPATMKIWMIWIRPSSPAWKWCSLTNTIYCCVHLWLGCIISSPAFNIGFQIIGLLYSKCQRPPFLSVLPWLVLLAQFWVSLLEATWQHVLVATTQKDHWTSQPSLLFFVLDVPLRSASWIISSLSQFFSGSFYFSEAPSYLAWLELCLILWINNIKQRRTHSLIYLTTCLDIFQLLLFMVQFMTLVMETMEDSPWAVSCSLHYFP